MFFMGLICDINFHSYLSIYIICLYPRTPCLQSHSPFFSRSLNRQAGNWPIARNAYFPFHCPSGSILKVLVMHPFLACTYLCTKSIYLETRLRLFSLLSIFPTKPCIGIDADGEMDWCEIWEKYEGLSYLLGCLLTPFGPVQAYSWICHFRLTMDSCKACTIF